MLWHTEPAWQLCVPSSHSSTSATQTRPGVRGRRAGRPLPAHPHSDLDGYKGLLRHRELPWSMPAVTTASPLTERCRATRRCPKGPETYLFTQCLHVPRSRL